MILEKVRGLVADAIKKLSLPEVDFSVEFPADLVHGDLATNAALVAARSPDSKFANSIELANKVKDEVDKDMPEWLERVEVAGAGFLNFWLSKKFFAESINGLAKGSGSAAPAKGGQAVSSRPSRKILIEYTDPNPFKEFHIGHMMSNSVGESLARLFEASGAVVKRLNYQGDVGLNVAKAVWGKIKNPEAKWGEAYAAGDRAYLGDETAKSEIIALNKKIYDRNDAEINALYDRGRAESLAEFEKMYTKLGTKFDHYFFESEVAEEGLSLIRANSGIGRTFVESEGTVIFRGEEQGLHTRVFITKEGLPTYEAKELGLNKKKFEIFPAADLNVIVTANEVNDYFRVVLVAMRELLPEVTEKTKHISHGLLKLPTGKMSSRTGSVITAEALITDVSERVRAEMAERKIGKEMATSNVDTLVEQIAIGAIKYSILKQAIGRDIIFDFEKSISFEGDSGPYLQYTFARTQSVLAKARSTKHEARKEFFENTKIERLLPRFSNVVERAASEYAPQHIVTFATEVASAFNSYYADHLIIDEKNPQVSAYRLALTTAVANVLQNCLWLLGITAPEKM